MIPFLFNENRFYFVAEHLLVGHLCTNPKSDEKLLSCLKVTQCSTNEIRDGPLYNSWLYRSKLWQQDYCQHPQNKNLDCHEYHLKHLYSCFSSHFCFLVFLDCSCVAVAVCGRWNKSFFDHFDLVWELPSTQTSMLASILLSMFFNIYRVER